MSLFLNEIANMALGRLGSTLAIQNVDTDNSSQAKAVRVQVKTSLKTVLEIYPWGFATKFAPLILKETNPLKSFSFSYTIPIDVLIIRKVEAEGFFRDKIDREDERNKFKEIFDSAGTIIYTDVGNAWVEYTIDLPSDIQFPNHFGRALSAQLALDIAPSVITNNFAKVQNVLLTRAENEINKQISIDISRTPRPDTSPSRFASVR